MTEQYQAEIKTLIETNGAMGVNALSKALNIPLSTMQKYMHKQSYFKINNQRKWDLPQKVLTSVTESSVKDFDTVIETQLSGLTALSDLLVNNIKSTIALLGTQKPFIAAVAAKTPDIDPQLLEMDKRLKETQAVFKKYVGVCPEEYQELIKNFDMYKCAIELGNKLLNDDFNTELSDLFLEKSDKLSDYVIEVLSDYQKES